MHASAGRDSVAISPVQPRDTLDQLDYLSRAGFANINATMIGGSMTLQSPRSSAVVLSRSPSPKVGPDSDSDSVGSVDNIMFLVPVRVIHSGRNNSDHDIIM